MDGEVGNAYTLGGGLDESTELERNELFSGASTDCSGINAELSWGVALSWELGTSCITKAEFLTLPLYELKWNLSSGEASLLSVSVNEDITPDV